MDKSKLYALSEQSSWDELPQTLKLVVSSTEVKYEVDKSNKAFIDLIKPFLGKDELRPIMTDIYFDDDCAVATDAHKLVTLPNTSSFRGYALGKNTTEKYVSYQFVIPEKQYLKTYKKFNITKLRTYISAIISGEYCNVTTFQISFKCDDLIFSFNGRFLDSVLQFFQKIGKEDIYIGIKGETAPFVFCENDSFDFKKYPLALLMPVLIQQFEGKTFLGSADFDLEKMATFYFDFADNQIHNADGSIAHFDSKLKNATKAPFNLDFAPIIKKMNKSKLAKSIAIIQNVCVENGSIRATSLDSSILCKLNGEVPDGIYQFLSDTLIKTPNESVSDYPLFNFKKADKKMVVNADFVDSFNYAGKISTDDDFKSNLMGVNLNVSKNSVRICGTDAHRMFYNTVACGSNSDFDVTIMPNEFTEYLSAVKGQPTTIYFDNSFFVENAESKFIGKVNDVPYARYIQMVEDNNQKYKDGEKIVYFNKSEVLALINSAKSSKNESIIFIVNPAKKDTLDVYYGIKEKRKIGSVSGGVSDSSGNYMSLKECSLLMPTIIKEIDCDFSFNIKYLKEYLSIVSVNDVNLYTAKDKVAPYFIDFKYVKIKSDSVKMPKPAPVIEEVKKVEVVEVNKPVAKRTVKPKEVKPVEVVEKPKMDEKFRILLNSELPAYMLSSINELGKKTNGFTEFDETTKCGSEKLVQLVKDFLEKKENEEAESVTKAVTKAVTKEVTKEVTKPDTKEQAPEMPKKNKDKLIAISKKIKLSLKYLKGDSKIKQQKVVKTLELAIKYLK